MLRSRKPRLDEALCAEHPELLEEHQNILARAQKCRSQEECAKLNNEIRILRSRMLEVGFIKASLPAYRKYDPQSTFTPSAAVCEDEAEFYTEPAEAADAVKEQEDAISLEEVALRFGRIWEAEPEAREARYYDPARHIRACEVKTLFKTLHPHGKHSTRLSIVDVTPGHADGEKYVICITDLGPDPHCPDVLSRVCGEPLASSRMVWMSKEIASKYAIVFDRDAVEGLIKTWKENDPVRDSRAEETARKERAKVRREAQGE